MDTPRTPRTPRTPEPNDAPPRSPTPTARPYATPSLEERRSQSSATGAVSQADGHP
jgi:hypothetical protein